MTVRKPVRGCLVGIGGYGRTHLRAFEELEKSGLAKLTAVVVRNPGKYVKELAPLESAGVRCFTNYGDAIAERNFDFVVISTPLQLHRPMVIEALEAGIPTLCEKSAAPTVQDVQMMADVQARTGVPLDIAYPMQSSEALIALQRALIDGCIGKVTDVVVRVAWLRPERYYERSGWAGRVKMDGLWTLDGPVNNPTAHYLYAGMYLASEERGRIASPARVRAELYRARPTIEGEDTACFEATFENGAKEYFYTTLVTADETYRTPRFEIFGEKGSVTWTSAMKGPIPVTRHDGKPMALSLPEGGGTTKRSLENFAQYLLGESTALYGPIGDSLRFARLSNGGFDSSRKVHTVAAEYVNRYESPLDGKQYVKQRDGETTRVYELKEIVPLMTRAGTERKLYGDLGAPWAVTTKPVNVTNYPYFPQSFVADELPWNTGEAGVRCE